VQGNFFLDAGDDVRRTLLFVLVVLMFAILRPGGAAGQSLTTGAIAGVVTDASGGVVTHAEVTAHNLNTDQRRGATTGPNGAYMLSQLQPGPYQVSVTAKGFKVARLGPIVVAVSRSANADFTLHVGGQTEVVEVTSATQLLEPANPNTTTSVNSQMIAALPNPGDDLTYLAQVAPGALMNTGGGGSGNVEFNGLPATSVDWTIDGLDANLPWSNVNYSGATNLMLGLNAISEASVNTLSYSVDQGRFGAAQVNFISKSGTNNWHGNAFETWNGRHLDAANWFVNAQPGPPCSAEHPTKCKPFSNMNQFGGSVGGPVLKDKLFLFGDFEGIQIGLPGTQYEQYPSQAYEEYVLNQIPRGGYDPANELTYVPPPNPAAAISYYKRAFALYGNPPGGVPIPTFDCPVNGDGSIIALAAGVPTPFGTGCALARTYYSPIHDSEWYLKTRLDHEINSWNRVWYAFRYNTGVQATYTDPVNSVFNAYSKQPANGVSVGYTHIFSTSLVNEFNPGYDWSSQIFQPTDYAAAKAAFPFVFVASGLGLSPIFGHGRSWPQGDNSTQWQLIDNMTWTHGAHTYKFGENLLRTLISNHDLGTNTTPRIDLGDAVQYSLDVIGSAATQGFATSLSEPIGLVSLDAYAQDTWKARRSLTVSYGLRATWNANPVSQQNDFARLAGSFYDIPHDVNQPLDQVILANQRNEFASARTNLWQPRAAIAWQVRPSTVVRVGGGFFGDVLPETLVDNLLFNEPNKNGFAAGALGSGNPIIATYAIPGSGNGIAGSPDNDGLGNLVAANRAFVAGFRNGVLSCAATNAPANCIPPIEYFTNPSGTFRYPYFAEWSATLQQQFGHDWTVRVQYAATKATDMAYSVAPNGFQTVCPGCFTPFIYDPTGKGPDGRFSFVTQAQVGANSSYNALQATLEKRFSGGLTFRANYTWSHCIDEESNEGLAFDYEASVYTYPERLDSLRGNCDYDVRHSFNGAWLYQLPSPARNPLLKQFLNGWQVSGNLFLHTGFPFSILSAVYGAHGNGVFNANPAGGFALPVAGVSKYARWQKLSTKTAGLAAVQWLNPEAFRSVVDVTTGHCAAGETFSSSGQVLATSDNPQTCQFATTGRNSVFAPGLAWTDIAIGKNFKLTERARFRFDVKFYNAFNHMNLGFPVNGAGVPQNMNTLQNAFVIFNAASPPTSLLGSGLGGDSSVRMIALSGRIEF
jgi:hypothetical protein